MFQEDPLAARRRPSAARVELPMGTTGQNAGFSFRVPKARPGRYLVIVFDGSEAGQHYTWDFVRVPPAAARLRREAYDITFWLVIAAGAGLVTAALVVLRCPRR
jgi:hypothetical protein